MRKVLIAAMRGRATGCSNDKIHWKLHFEIGEGISNTLTSVAKDNLVRIEYV